MRVLITTLLVYKITYFLKYFSLHILSYLLSASVVRTDSLLQCIPFSINSINIPTSSNVKNQCRYSRATFYSRQSVRPEIEAITSNELNREMKEIYHYFITATRAIRDDDGIFLSYG